VSLGTCALLEAQVLPTHPALKAPGPTVTTSTTSNSATPAPRDSNVRPNRRRLIAASWSAPSTSTVPREHPSLPITGALLVPTLHTLDQSRSKIVCLAPLASSAFKAPPILRIARLVITARKAPASPMSSPAPRVTSTISSEELPLCSALTAERVNSVLIRE